MTDVPVILVFTLLWVASLFLVLTLYFRLSFSHLSKQIRRAKNQSQTYSKR